MVSKRERLIDAAEKLFAERGFAGVGIREITDAAQANAAAVNYYFGTKRGLYLAVLRRHVEPINRERIHRLEMLQSLGSPIAVRSLLEALLLPALEAVKHRDGALNIRLMRLANRIPTESAVILEQIDRELFRDVAARFVDAIGKSLPSLSQEQVRMRFLLTIGLLLGTLGQFANREHGSESLAAGLTFQRISEELIAFASVGFQSEHGLIQSTGNPKL